MEPPPALLMTRLGHALLNERKKKNAHNPAPVDNFFSRHSHAAYFSSLSKSCVSSREKWLSSVIIPVECFASAGFAGEEKHNSFRNLDNAISKSSWRREPDVYTEVIIQIKSFAYIEKTCKKQRVSIFNFQSRGIYRYFRRPLRCSQF